MYHFAVFKGDKCEAFCGLDLTTDLVDTRKATVGDDCQEKILKDLSWQ